MKKILAFLICCFVFYSPVRASDEETVVLPDTALIDVPAASTLDKMSFRFSSRLYSGGGTQIGLGFGVHDRIIFGTSFLLDGLIGDSSHVSMRTPEIDLKYRFWDGGNRIPALALGYGGQGYFYDSKEKKYQEERKGLYLTGTSEIFSSFFLNAGINISDFDNNHLFGFAGFSYALEESVSIMAEYDNLFHHASSCERLNAGLRIRVSEDFSLDMAVRNINSGGKYKNGEKRQTERILQLHYTTRFN
ncbi:MAG: hypothetical protein J5706_05005 [Elusimicrobiales bacterium]|nr:hypothetical protein [Elusimicrobiales bacterium]